MPTPPTTQPVIKPATQRARSHDDLLGHRPASTIEAKPIEFIEANEPPVVTTGRLAIRALREADGAAYTRVLGGVREALHGVLPIIAPGESVERAFETQLRLTRDGDRRCVAWRRVAETSEGRLVGGVAVRDIQRGLGNTGDVLWWVAADARRQGFGVEIVGAAIRHAFADLPEGLGLDTLTAMIQPSNLASKRLARAIGFQRDEAADIAIEIHGASRPHEAWRLDAPRVGF
ncbi:MAG: GNAT family protein [Planctomycetota bacterium]